IFFLTGPKGLRTSLKESKYKYQVAHWLEELGRAMNIFKLSGKSGLPMQRTNSLANNYLVARKSHFRILIVQYGSVVLFKTVVTAALLLLGSLLVIDNQISIGQFVAAEIVVILILGSAEKLILSMETIYDVLTGLEKIGYLTDLPLEVDDGIPFREICEDGDSISIEIDDLGFRYRDAQKHTLSELNLNIKKGERLCVAGYNSSGKSTLAQLVAGLYTDFEGMITYNNVPLHSLNIESLREHIGSLGTQDDLFNASILENINLGKNIDLKEIIAIARAIDLHHYINHLPDGYKSILLAGGLNVPRSVRAKIILARAIIANPSLLVIDHFIPRIEQKEKKKIIDFLTDKDKKWTLVAVSSNPELARQCDRVIVLKDGKIVAEGHFNDILSNQHVQEVFKLVHQEAKTT
ncbi:MAG: ATP-binding cassette domain-containing protein, partial [Bacteroidota bacterium]